MAAFEPVCYFVEDPDAERNGVVDRERTGSLLMPTGKLHLGSTKQYEGLYNETVHGVQYEPYSEDDIRDMDFTNILYDGSCNFCGVDEYVGLQVMLRGQLTDVYMKRCDQEWLDKMRDCFNFVDPSHATAGYLDMNTSMLYIQTYPKSNYKGIYSEDPVTGVIELIDFETLSEIDFTTLVFKGDFAFYNYEEFIGLSTRLVRYDGTWVDKDLWFKLSFV